MGGLSGKAFQIEKSKEKSALPHLIVDAGNLLFKRKTRQPKTPTEMLTAETIQQAYGAMGYDAVAVSESDFAAGTAFLKNSEKTDLTWISANLFDTTGKLLFEPFIVKKIGKITVGVIGLTGPGQYQNEKIVIGDWREPLRQQLQDLNPRTDMLILLSNFPSTQNKLIAKSFPELNLIFTADKNRGNTAPYIEGNVLITQSQNKGKYLGKLSVQYAPEGRWSNDTQLQQLVKPNRFKADFIAIRPKSPQSQEINLMIRELKKKIRLSSRKN